MVIQLSTLYILQKKFCVLNKCDENWWTLHNRSLNLDTYMLQVLTPGKNLWHKIRVSTCTHCPTIQDRNQFNIYSMLWQEMHPHWFITLPWVSSCLQIVIQSPALTILKASSFLIYSWAINISLHKNSHHTSGWTLNFSQ